MRTKQVLVGTAAAMSFLLTPVAAGASESPSANQIDTPVETVSLINEVDPTGMEVVSVVPEDGHLVSEQNDVDVSLPATAAGSLALENENGHIEVSVPGVGPAKVVEDSVVYDNALPATDVVAQAVDGGARQVFILQDETAKPTVTFDIKSADAEKVTFTTNENGSLNVVNGAGVDVAGVNAPWAVDATGAALPTRFEVDGTKVTQHIETEGAVFPVSADPTVCGNKIDRVSRFWRDGGWTLSVRPTGCGRWWNGYSGWVEAQRESGRWYSGSRGNSMWNQYICHFDWAPYKSTWNLDEWRPDRGYWGTVRSGCNPK